MLLGCYRVLLLYYINTVKSVALFRIMNWWEGMSLSEQVAEMTAFIRTVSTETGR